MMTGKKYKLLILLALAVSYCYGQQKRDTHRPFRIYGFVVYNGYLKNGVKTPCSFAGMQSYLKTIGIGKYNLIYESRVLDYPANNKDEGIVNTDKIEKLAQLAGAEPKILVSLDLEGWKRFDTLRTPTRLIAAIRAFKKTDSLSLVGLYATVPQDTFGYPANPSLYDRLNQSYAGVAAAVDYFSPSLYNYKTTDSLEWQRSAAYNIEACRKYGYAQKPIIPYITPEVWLKGASSSFLTYQQMFFRLQTLYNLGADGCLLWTSSGMREPNGERVFVDENSGWLKAVKDFIRLHPDAEFTN